MTIYTYLGCTIEVAKGGQSASVNRVEIRGDEGQIIQQSARKTFAVIPEIGSPSPEVQAQRWTQKLVRFGDYADDGPDEVIADEMPVIESGEVEGEE